MLSIGSLLLNILVLVPICLSLVGKHGWVEAAYGRGPARGIRWRSGAILLASAAVPIAPAR